MNDEHRGVCMEGKNSVSEEKKVAMRVSSVSIVVNLVLSLLKLFAGIVANSGAMISDAVHSASDVFSTLIVILGVNISSKESDREHQYGHERLECVAAIVLSVILLATGLGIGLKGIEEIIEGSDTIETPRVLALCAAVISIVVKEWMFWYTRAAARKTNYGALMADAWHHRSDALSSVGAFLGIFGARMGYPILDPIASIVICIFIVKASVDIFKDAIDKLVDKSCDDKIMQSMKARIKKEEGVLEIDDIRTRLFGTKIYVDIEIAADSTIPLSEAHEIAERVHDVIEREYENVKHCMVHVNPRELKKTQKEK